MYDSNTWANIWADLREFWLSMCEKGYSENHSVLIKTKEMLFDYHPTDIPSTHSGDSGYVYFEDGSSLHWDWDNGDFCREYNGEALTYPHYTEDPLFWNYETKEY